MRQSIPNSLTASNLFCGTLALVAIWQGNLWAVLGLLAAALLLDFLDGFVARMLNVSSPVGKELDSLADVISFGVVPAFIMARLIRLSQGQDFPDDAMWTAGPDWLWMAGLLIAAFSALRLARFNLDTRQSDTFFGLPTPSNTMFVLGLWLLIELKPEWALVQAINHPVVLVGVSLFFCWLMLANVQLLALKFSSFGWKGNEFRYLLLGGSVILLATLGWVAISFIILYYLALSLVHNLRDTKNLTGIASH